MAPRWRRKGTHRSIRRERIDIDVIKRDILAVDEEVCPARRVELRNSLDREPRCILRDEEDGPVVCVIRVEDLLSCELVVPALAIAVQ
jgi:hypothetical protein